MAKMTNHQLELLTEVALEQVKEAFESGITDLKKSKKFKDFEKSLEKEPYVKAAK